MGLELAEAPRAAAGQQATAQPQACAGFQDWGRKGRSVGGCAPPVLVCQVLEELGFGANSAGHPHLRLSHGGGRGPLGSPKINLQKALFSFQK